VYTEFSENVVTVLLSWPCHWLSWRVQTAASLRLARW